MLRVSSTDPRWKRPGIAGTHLAALLGIDEFGGTPLKLWADRVSLRRKIEMKKVPSLEQGSPTWLKWRGDGVGGSEVAGVCGESRYDDPLAVWKAKVGQRRGDAAENVENEHMARGKRLEPVARRHYESLMGWQSPPLCVIDDQHEFIRCSLDGLRTPSDDLVLEIKSPGDRNHEKSLRLVDEPSLFRSLIPHYYCQVQYQLMITGAKAAHFVSYNESPQFGPNRFALVEVPADAAYQQFVREAVIDFWGYVEREEPPPSH